MLCVWGGTDNSECTHPRASSASALAQVSSCKRPRASVLRLHPLHSATFRPGRKEVITVKLDKWCLAGKHTQARTQSMHRAQHPAGHTHTTYHYTHVHVYMCTCGYNFLKDIHAHVAANHLLLPLKLSFRRTAKNFRCTYTMYMDV